MAIKTTKKDIIWNYIGTIMTLLSNVVLLPFMIYFIDSELLGLWYVFLSIGGIVVLFDFGFNPTFSRNFAYAWSGAIGLNKTGVRFIEKSDPNYKLLGGLLKTCKKIYFRISLSALMLMLVFGTGYVHYISKNINGHSHLFAWLIYSIAVFLNLYYGYYAAALRGVGAISQVNKSNIISRAIQIVSSLLLMFMGFQLIAVAVAYLLNGTVFRILAKRYFENYSDIGININIVKNQNSIDETKEIFSAIWHNAWRDGLVSVSGYLSNQASTLVVSMFLSLTETGIYSVSVQLVTAISVIAGSLYNSYQPALQSAYINNNPDESKKLMSIIVTVYYSVFWLGILGLIFVGIPIIELIKPDITINVPILILISIYIFLYKQHNYFASYISNTNNVPYVKAFILSSTFGIILSVLLMYYTELGIWALVGAQIITQLVFNNWYWPMSVTKMLQTNIVSMLNLGFNIIIKRIKPWGGKLWKKQI